MKKAWLFPLKKILSSTFLRQKSKKQIWDINESWKIFTYNWNEIKMNLIKISWIRNYYLHRQVCLSYNLYLWIFHHPKSLSLRIFVCLSTDNKPDSNNTHALIKYSIKNENESYITFF